MEQLQKKHRHHETAEQQQAVDAEKSVQDAELEAALARVRDINQSTDVTLEQIDCVLALTGVEVA